MHTFNVTASERERERKRGGDFFQMVPLHKLDDPGGDDGSVALNPVQQVQM